MISQAQANQKKMNLQGCSCGFNQGRNMVKPATNIITTTSNEIAIVFRRERSSRSNPRVTWIANGAS